MEHPMAMICMEADPVECYRHRLFLALARYRTPNLVLENASG
jgi:hypothetical protein